MSSASSISSTTISGLLSSLTAKTATTAATAASTDTSSTTSSSAYSLDITPGLIKAAIANTYDTQLLDLFGTDSTTSAVTLYDYYNHLSSSSLKYVLSSQYDFLSNATGSSTDSSDSASTSASTDTSSDT
ncbi:MAG: hypothetical protein P4N41_23980 [Negativicutes bacterium]|nr:hypothetical protein [Negativicutes bacterium]